MATMNVTNKYLIDTYEVKNIGGLPFVEIRPALICVDGFVMSVQASQYHYCTPRVDIGPYSNVEVGYPSKIEDSLLEYAETPDDPTGTVYGYVPVEVIDAVIEKHGGIVATE